RLARRHTPSRSAPYCPTFARLATAPTTLTWSRVLRPSEQRRKVRGQATDDGAGSVESRPPPGGLSRSQAFLEELHRCSFTCRRTSSGRIECLPRLQTRCPCH